MPKRKARKDGLLEKKVKVGGKTISVYGHNERELKAKAEELLSRAAYGTVDKKITLAEWADKWLATYKDGNVRPNTYETTYRISVDKIKAYFKNARLAEIKPVDIQEFFNSHSFLSQSRLDKLKITLKSIFETAIENELIIRNPVHKSVKPKSDQVQEEKQVYTRDEAAEIFKFAKTHQNGAAVITILKTGLRRGELCGLKWSDVDFKSNTLTVRRSVSLSHGSAKVMEPKTATSKREIPFDDELKAVLLAIPRNLRCEFVFTTVTGKMLNPDNWSKRMYADFMYDYSVHYKEQHGQAPRILNPHELRHTFGTFLYEATGDIYITSKIMGHSSPNITAKIYVHERTETKQAAIAKILPFS